MLKKTISALALFSSFWKQVSHMLLHKRTNSQLGSDSVDNDYSGGSNDSGWATDGVKNLVQMHQNNCVHIYMSCIVLQNIEMWVFMSTSLIVTEYKSYV